MYLPTTRIDSYTWRIVKELVRWSMRDSEKRAMLESVMKQADPYEVTWDVINDVNEGFFLFVCALNIEIEAWHEDQAEKFLNMLHGAINPSESEDCDD